MRRLVLALMVAASLWFVMFSSLTAPHLNFWWAMTGSACVLMALALPVILREGDAFSLCSPGQPHSTSSTLFKELLLGLLIAAVLWCVFWVGDKLSALLFDFARPQVDSIYGMKAGNQGWLIGLLLLFVIGPAEELFWRGYVQRSLAKAWDANRAFVVTTLVYGLVHVPSMNFMLVMAALTCGLCWGLLYRLWPQHLPAIVLSHAVWDAAVFVWFPI